MDETPSPVPLTCLCSPLLLAWTLGLYSGRVDFPQPLNALLALGFPLLSVGAAVSAVLDLRRLRLLRTFRDHPWRILLHATGLALAGLFLAQVVHVLQDGFLTPMG